MGSYLFDSTNLITLLQAAIITIQILNYSAFHFTCSIQDLETIHIIYGNLISSFVILILLKHDMTHESSFKHLEVESLLFICF